MSPPAPLGVVSKTDAGEEIPREASAEDNIKFAAFLRTTHAAVFEKLDRLQKSLDTKPTPKGKVPDEIPDCSICKAEKHVVKWICRRGGQHGQPSKVLVTGSCCYACYRASILLACSRSPALLDAAGATRIFLSMSASVRNNMGDLDVCSCHLCK